MNAHVRAALVAAVLLTSSRALAEDTFLCATGFFFNESADAVFRNLGCSQVPASSVAYSNVPSAGPGSPDARFGPVTVNMVLDHNAVKLIQAAGDGAELPVPVVISWRRPGLTAEPYATLTLEHVRVSEVHVSFAGGDTAQVRVVLRASKMSYAVRPVLGNGSLGEPVTVPWEATP